MNQPNKEIQKTVLVALEHLPEESQLRIADYIESLDSLPEKTEKHEHSINRLKKD